MNAFQQCLMLGIFTIVDLEVRESGSEQVMTEADRGRRGSRRNGCSVTQMGQTAVEWAGSAGCPWG